jgi:hypothetical protein
MDEALRQADRDLPEERDREARHVRRSEAISRR